MEACAMKMKPGDWIDASEIGSPETLEAVREAVRDMGWHVGGFHGTWDVAARENAAVLVLDDDGDLLWEYVLNDDGNQVHVSDLIGPKPKGHPAAAILREIADEIESGNPRPWEAFEWWYENGQQWVPCKSLQMALDRAAVRPYEIRRKPRTKRIGTYDVPLPEREALEYGQAYHIADPGAPNFQTGQHLWAGDSVDVCSLHRGLVHLDPESAETHGRALASLMREDEE